jgi:hypothetical protein
MRAGGRALTLRQVHLSAKYGSITGGKMEQRTWQSP